MGVGRAEGNERWRTRVSKTEPVRGAAKGQETTIGLDCAYKTLEQFPYILLYSEFLYGRQELDHEIYETLREFSEESLL